MTTIEFLSRLRRSGIRIWGEGDRLGVRAEAGILTPAIKQELANRKVEILALIQDGHATPAATGPAPVSRDQMLTLSSGERRLWFLSQLEPDGYAYNVPTCLRLRGPVDPSALRRGLEAVVTAHEGLRTSYRLQDGLPTRQILEPVVRFHTVDLLPIGSDRLEDVVLSEARRPFSLERDPLMRAVLARRDQHEQVLILTLHHIVCDGWSLGVLLRDLESAYNSIVTGRPSAVRPPAIQFADYAIWEDGWLRTREAARQLDYWKERLAGDLPALQLAADRFCRDEGVTPFMVFLAAFQVVLHRYTRQDDLLVGSPVANRRQAATEDVIGFFVNTLVLRTRVTSDLSFRSLVACVRETTLGAYEHQEYPFEKLVEGLQPQRDLATPPLCQVMFALQNEPLPLLRLHGAEPAQLEYPGGTAKFDLTLFVRQTAGGSWATAEYNVDLFGPETMRRLLGHFTTILAAGVTAPDRAIGELDMLSATERQTLVVDWNRTDAHFDRDVCVNTLFERQVQRTPGAVAIVQGDNHLTYDELNRRANRLARRLHAAGIGHQARVGVCLQASPRWLVAVLGILKIGATYVPLDPQYPPARLSMMADGAALAALVTEPQTTGRIQVGVTLIELETTETTASEDARNPNVVGTSDDLLYVIFTSGSTGGPKGAAVRHRAFVNLLSWYVSELEIGATDRVLLASSPSFDLTQKNLFAPLMVGGELHFASADRYDPSLSLDTIDRAGITIVNCTPSAFYPIVERAANDDFKRLRSLRAVVLGGEPIAKSQLRPWIDSPAGHAEVFNTYGPTECTDIVAAHRLGADDWASASPVPIGRPIWNTRLIVLDDEGRLVPAGVPGELCVLGEAVGPGYVNDAALTAARFLPSTYTGLTETRRYRTGDRVRQRPDGTIEFLSRVDHQVKMRGYRIELGDIEHALASHPDVRECAVCVIGTDAEGSPKTPSPFAASTRLTAFVAFERGREVPPVDLKRFLLERLPEYMVPAAYAALEALPLTPSGKVDRLALARLERSAMTSTVARTSPKAATDVEQRLSKVWCDLLGVACVGVQDNFFDLGGHSLLMVRLQHAIQLEFQRDLSIVDLFRAPSIAGLARLLTASPAEPNRHASAVARARRQHAAMSNGQ